VGTKLALLTDACHVWHALNYFAYVFLKHGCNGNEAARAIQASAAGQKRGMDVSHSRMMSRQQPAICQPLMR
jgi:hypothetical protein